MTKQFLRRCSLNVLSGQGDTLDLSEFHIQFYISHATQQTPRAAEITIYNPNSFTVNDLKNIYSSISLSVGYDDEISLLFQGKIRQVFAGKENGTDTFIKIIAVTGDVAYAEAVTSAVLPAGWTHETMYRQLLSDLNHAEPEITSGVAPKGTGSGSRPCVMYGMTRQFARDLARSTSCTWNIDHRGFAFDSIPDMSKRQRGEDVVILSPETGLIGIPLQTFDGVEATCLLNPELKRNTLVAIEDSMMPNTRAETSYTETNDKNIQFDKISSGAKHASIIGKSTIGLYRVVYVEHTGNTRGQAWYSNVHCVAVDGSST